MKKKAALLILDGWGIGDRSKSDGIYNANTPFMDKLMQNSPNGQLLTDGEHVGLPKGQMGNSEVGHLNIGAGRIVYQELTRINKSISDGEFQKNKIILDALNHAKKNNKNVHFMGLVSTGGVHSSIEHLFALCDLTKEMEIPNVFIHAFTDGRDCSPTSGLGQLKSLEDHLKTSNGKVASVIGRYYGMDRDNRWERVKLSYDLLTKGKGKAFSSSTEAIQSSYNNNITDEFIEPSVITENGQVVATINEGDVVICFNFRTDRCREITTALTQKDITEENMVKMELYYVTMTNYDSNFKNVRVVFEKENLNKTIGQVVAENGLNQIRIAETEKYPHVSFFFSGGREKEFENEKRIMINSPKVATYDLQPEMSALKVKNAICEEMKANEPEFICLNFANTDMVGHTGVYSAILKAAETVDSCVEEIVKLGKELNYSFIIIADHGNSDYCINEDGSPNTAHSLNPVPVIVLSEKAQNVKNGTLRDVAPTLLDLLDITPPQEMTGVSLLKN